eukprot:Selendium_serpulae@DN6177_c4_g1_i2.p1
MTFQATPTAAALRSDAERLKATHLRTLLADPKRCQRFISKVKLANNEFVLDMTRAKVDGAAMDKLLAFAEERKLSASVAAMFNGDKINGTEGRQVLHAKLRDPQAAGEFAAVVETRDKIFAFAEKVRSGEWKGVTGKPLRSVVAIGIGGSYLGPEFAYEALSTHHEAARNAEGRTLRFLANIDPVDVKRALRGLDAEETLVIVISKTFTTAETMLNAKTVVEWLKKELKDKPDAVAKHVAAVSTNLKATGEFGIDPANVFGFWEWVGGRFSVCSAVGLVPLALHFGGKVVQGFLDGAHEMDKHFQSAPLAANLPMLMGLVSVWNYSFLKLPSVAVLPYSQALLRFTAHIQQLTMESNGKRVTVDGAELPEPCGETFFGEPGTNGQHSFYQLLHQGSVIPAEFIGFIKSQNPIHVADEAVSNHDELMSNFFAQPDALAFGKTRAECVADKVPTELLAHKTFPGDRPSLMLMMRECDAFHLGALLALYEHRTAVEGFLWGVNSFDQWGVELGKVLAKNVRGVLADPKAKSSPDAVVDERGAAMSNGTRVLLKEYLKQR